MAQTTSPIHVKMENQGSGSETSQIHQRLCRDMSSAWWMWKAKGSEGTEAATGESEALPTGTDWKPGAPCPQGPSRE